MRIPELAVAIALLAGAAGATQWREVEAPTVVPVEGLALSPVVPGALFASLRTPSKKSVPGAGSAWSSDDGATWQRTHGRRTPLLTEVLPHPTDPQVLWGANGMCWMSSDAGASWTRVFYSYNAIEALAVDPLDPDHLLGVGYVISPGASLHESLDGGIHWTSSSPIFFDCHNDVLFVPDPGGSAVLLASQSGINRSTDGGATFVNVLSGQSGTKLALAAGDPSLVWCITALQNGKTRLWRSVDGGASWSNVTTPGKDLNDVAAHPTDPARAWVADTQVGVLYTADAGQTWSPGAGLSHMANPSSLQLELANPQVLFAGGRGGQGGVWRSADGGLSWTPASAGLRTPIPELRFDAAQRVWAVGLGVPLRRDLSSGPWEVLDYDKGATSRAASLSVHPQDTATIAWLAERPQWWKYDRVQVSTDDGLTWNHVTPGPAQSSTWTVRQVAFDSAGRLFAGSQYGDLHWSDDLGASWTTLDAPWSLLRDLLPDPHGTQRLLATDNGWFYRSLDRGQTWSRHAIGPAAARLPVDLSVDAGDPERLFVLAGQPQLQLHRSADGGQSWSHAGVGLPATGLERLAADPVEPGRVLVGTVNGAYLSLDGGATFAPWSEGLEEETAVSVAFEPHPPGRAWLSTANGRLFVRALE